MDDVRRHAPATLRNREPILAVLSRVLGDRRTVLELASGSGEHAVWFAARLEHLVWQPSDVDPSALASIAAHRADAGLSNLRAPLALDACSYPWPVSGIDAVVCCNMIHIAPWPVCDGLLRGAASLLGVGAPLYLYGPFKIGGAHTAPSNARFDEELRARNPAFGVRDLDVVVACARTHGLALDETVAMPANNLSVIFRCERPSRDP